MDLGLALQENSEPKKPNQIEPKPFNLSEHEPTKEANHKDDETFSSSAYTSDDSSDDDEFFQLDPFGLDPPISSSLTELTQSNLWSSSGTPPFHPKIRTDIPNPNRIPSSVFARTKSTSPMEWSVASNESLFSINAGNSSFSRDNVFVMGLDNYMPPISPISSPLPSMYPTVSSTPNVSVLEAVDELEPLDTANNLLRVDSEEQDSDKELEKDERHFTKSVSRLSDGSIASFQSFAFPVLTKDGGKNGSVRIQPEHQRMQSQLAEQQTPKIAENIEHTAADPVAPASPPSPPAAKVNKGWFSCFSCCPSCR